MYYLGDPLWRLLLPAQFHWQGLLLATVDQEDCPHPCAGVVTGGNIKQGYRAEFLGGIVWRLDVSIQRQTARGATEELERVERALSEQTIAGGEDRSNDIDNLRQAGDMEHITAAEKEVEPLGYHQRIFQVVDFLDEMGRFRPAPCMVIFLYQTFHSSHER